MTTMAPLIEADELQELLASGAGPVLLDVRWYLTEPLRGRQEYQSAHLPGAYFIDLDQDLSAPVRIDGTGGRHPLPDPMVLQSALRRAGVDDDSHVVVLDQGPSLAAGRLWWMLRDAGLERVQVLNGGWQAWLAAGGEPSDVAPMVGAGSVTVRPGQRGSVDADQVQQIIDEGSARVWDVRAGERYRGEVEPIDAVAGHIPGAGNLPATDLVVEGRFAGADELRTTLAELRPGDVVQCGSGVTAAQVLLAAEQAGIDGLRLYPGSWSDWISNPDRPVAQG